MNKVKVGFLRGIFSVVFGLLVSDLAFAQGTGGRIIDIVPKGLFWVYTVLGICFLFIAFYWMLYQVLLRKSMRPKQHAKTVLAIFLFFTLIWIAVEIYTFYFSKISPHLMFACLAVLSICFFIVFLLILQEEREVTKK